MAIPLTRITLDGSLKLHDIGYDITSAGGVRVYVNNARLDKPVEYSVIGSTDELREAKGKIELVSAYQSGDVLVIIRDTEEARVTNFAKAARFEEKEIDNEFDNYLRLLEDALMYLTATPHFAPSLIGTVDGELPEGVPGAVIRLNDAGTGFDFIKVEDFPEFAELLAKAKQSEVNAAQSASEANDDAVLARKWAEGETPSGGAPADDNNAKYWSEQAKQATAGKIDKVGGDTGAARIPSGTEQQAPDTTGELLALIRHVKGEGFKGFDPELKEWGSLGGGLAKFEASTGTAKINTPTVVDMSDDTAKTLVVPAGWKEGYWFAVGLTGWTGNPSATVTIKPDSSYQWDGGVLNQGGSLVIGGNQVAFIQIVNGKLKLVQAIGEEQRVAQRASGSFTSADGKTITVDNGIITSIV